MQATDIFKKLQERGTMPSPSRVALEIMRLCRDDTSSIDQIAKVVETDPALASELLKYANSVMFSPGSQVMSVKKAAIKLGLKNVRNLALGFSLLSQNRSGVCDLFDYKTFWSHSLARAVACHSLAELADNLDPDDLFVCGLLSHIGHLTLATIFPKDYESILAEYLDRRQLLEREKEQFGIDHFELGGELFNFWQLPALYADSVKQLALPASAAPVNDRVLQVGNVLQLAALIAEICMQEETFTTKIAEAEESAYAFGLGKVDFANIFDAITESWQRWGHTFQVPTRNCPPFKRIKETSLSPSLGKNSKQDEETLRILVVDDDPMTLHSLKHLLQKKGQEIYTADDGETALTLALEYQPHMVITDWRMPKIDGLDLCKILRNTSNTRHIYIIMLTGKETDDELIQALEAGADDFVVKPFITKVLEARIRSGERIIRYQRTINQDREVIEQYAARLASANRKLRNLAMTDVLTGLPNRRSALSRLKEVVSEAKRHQEALCCIMIDIDHFKEINDNYGHDIGDAVLKELATIFSTSARSYDMVSRIGGEEFLVLCARSSLDDSKQLAERLRREVENFRLEYNGLSIAVTISLGVAAWHSKMEDGEALTRQADQALYQAKQLGRNRVEIIEN